MNRNDIEIQRCNACGATIDEQETACPDCGRDDCLMYPFVETTAAPSPDPRPAHTPGPWTVGDRQPDKHAVNVLDARGFLTAQARAAGAGWTDAKANARLIAAAPDLLEALRDLMRETRAAVGKYNVRKHYSLMVAEVAADKAIRKATNQ